MGSKARGVEIVGDSPHGTVVKAMFVRCCSSGEQRSNVCALLQLWRTTIQSGFMRDRPQTPEILV